MKSLYTVFIFLVVCSLSAQDTLSSLNWQEDLRFLQTTINEKYPFLFKKIRQTEFNEAVEIFYKDIPKMEPHEVVVGFSKIIAMFKYGHTRMAYSDAPIPFHSIKVEFYRFKDGLYIKSTHKDHQELLGAKVMAIEDMPIAQVQKAIYPTVPVENKMYFDAYGLDHMTIPEVLHAQGVNPSFKNTIKLTLVKNGKQFDKVLQATPGLWPPMRYGEVLTDSD